MWSLRWKMIDAIKKNAIQNPSSQEPVINATSEN
jgi:hypothetical protein